ncbi:hypothetical protein GCM10018793_39110 [Streptomyces sulfonofaciens]|uniref:DUF3152 domain-containing protein n=2 Tax=Streptomyces sulfonofaciens TaxID=68272 RepID=A0A919GBL9_9ACTN|nr:hypothetical protein GCM10018793_39110 [Streptomyces sulfonofaciens]
MPVVPDTPGPGRRRRQVRATGTGPQETPRRGTPQVPPGTTPSRAVPPATGPVTPPQGVPQVRGGHPEHRESGGGWGAAGAAPPEPPARPGRRHPTTPPRGTGSPGLAGARSQPSGAGATPSPAGAGGPRVPGPRLTAANPPGSRIPGPRQEYIDAFGDDDAPDHGKDDGVDAVTRRRTPHGETAVSETLVTDWEGGADGGAASARPASAAGSGSGSGSGAETAPAGEAHPDGGEPAGKARSGKGRTFAGIAAAAVTTVLAVVVAGQVTEGRHDGSASAQSADRQPRGADSASRSKERHGSGRPAPAPAPLTYDQKMGRKYPLAPELKGSGKFDAVRGFEKAPGEGQLYRYRVDVEKGLGLDGALFAQAVQKTLNDNRSWAHGGGRTFERISSGKPDFVITLASPGTTAAWCAKSGLDTTEDNVSCDSAATDRVMINAYRWAQGAKTYGNAIHPYRQMLINHEVGHRLGFNHVVCTKNGALAPVMQQQTKFLTYDGITCKPNAWPFPGKPTG